VALSDQETGINARLDFVGVYSRIAGFAVGPVLERRTRDFFDDLSRECQKRVQRRQSRAANPGNTT
jgi:hypothetical protein